MPITTTRIVPETKYGKIIRARPQRSGTTRLCLFPYIKNPIPMEPNSKPHRSKEELNAASRSV
jgi:hypothetical protein